MVFIVIDRFHFAPSEIRKMTLRELKYYYSGVEWLVKEEEKALKKVK